MSTPSKHTLNRKVLRDEKIFFYDHIHESSELPEWFRSTSQYMRHIRKKAPTDSKKDFKDELETFRNSGQDGKTAVASGWSLKPSRETGYMTRESFGKSVKRTSAETEMEATLVDCLRVRDLAIDLRKKRSIENLWVPLLLAEFFKTYKQVYDTEDENRDLYRQWELHVDLLWNGCPSWDTFTSPVRTEPKPDIAYLFPIIDDESKIAKEYRFDNDVKNFTLPVLSELRKRERVISSPKTSLLSCDPTKPKHLGASDLACFPWTIVEVKHDTDNSGTAEFCYCQAANGSAEALKMREGLAKKIQDPKSDALVIFSFTCVGPSVRLWLTFRNTESKNIEMRCIWATSLELTWGVFALRTVIDNMHEWVYKRVKPEISRWITHVRIGPKPKTTNTPDGDEVEQRRRARSVAPPPEDRPTVSPSVQPRPASDSKISRTFMAGNTVPRQPLTPSPLSRHSAPPPDTSKPASQSNSTPASARAKTVARSAKSPKPPSRPSAYTIVPHDKTTPASSSLPPKSASCSKNTATSSKDIAALRDPESPSARYPRRSNRRTTLPNGFKESEDGGDDAADDDDFVLSAGSSDDEADEGYASGRGCKGSKSKRRVRKSNVV